MRVVAAMSGGVDSSVAAARMIEAGHEVVGVHLALARKPESSRQGSRGCCTLDDARDARRVADMLGIPFYVWDFAERFADDVIENAGALNNLYPKIAELHLKYLELAAQKSDSCLTARPCHNKAT